MITWWLQLHELSCNARWVHVVVPVTNDTIFFEEMIFARDHRHIWLNHYQNQRSKWTKIIRKRYAHFGVGFCHRGNHNDFINHPNRTQTHQVFYYHEKFIITFSVFLNSLSPRRCRMKSRVKVYIARNKLSFRFFASFIGLWQKNKFRTSRSSDGHWHGLISEWISFSFSFWLTDQLNMIDRTHAYWLTFTRAVYFTSTTRWWQSLKLCVAPTGWYRKVNLWAWSKYWLVSY